MVFVTVNAAGKDDLDGSDITVVVIGTTVVVAFDCPGCIKEILTGLYEVDGTLAFNDASVPLTGLVATGFDDFFDVIGIKPDSNARDVGVFFLIDIRLPEGILNELPLLLSNGGAPFF